MSVILGFNAFHADSAACLVVEHLSRNRRTQGTMEFDYDENHPIGRRILLAYQGL